MSLNTSLRFTNGPMKYLYPPITNHVLFTSFYVLRITEKQRDRHEVPNVRKDLVQGAWVA